jgi:hypothetical protein
VVRGFGQLVGGGEHVGVDRTGHHLEHADAEGAQLRT